MERERDHHSPSLSLIIQVQGAKGRPQYLSSCIKRSVHASFPMSRTSRNGPPPYLFIHLALERSCVFIERFGTVSQTEGKNDGCAGTARLQNP